MQIRRLISLADELRVRFIPSLHQLALPHQVQLVEACTESLVDGEIRSQASFAGLVAVLPRPVGDELCAMVGFNLLLRVRAARMEMLPPQAIDLMARYRVLTGSQEPLDGCGKPLEAALARRQDLTRFFWIDQTPWSKQAPRRRRDILTYLHGLAYAGRREGISDEDKMVHERLGSQELDDRLYRLQARDRRLLSDVIGAFGKMLFRLALRMQEHSFPQAALPFVSAHFSRSKGNLFATDGLPMELNQQLLAYQGKTADRIWLA